MFYIIKKFLLLKVLLLSKSFLCGMNVTTNIPHEIVIKCGNFLAKNPIHNDYYRQFGDEHTPETVQIFQEYLQSVNKDYVSFMTTCKHFYKSLNVVARLPHLNLDVFFTILNMDVNRKQVRFSGSGFFPEDLSKHIINKSLLWSKDENDNGYSLYLYHIKGELYFCMDYFPSTDYQELTTQNNVNIVDVENTLKDYGVDQTFKIWQDWVFLRQYIEKSNIYLNLGPNVISISAPIELRYDNILFSLLIKYYALPDPNVFIK